MFVKDTKTEQCKNSQIPYHRCFFFSGLIIGAFIDMFARFLKSESKCFQWRRCNLWSFLLEHACHNSTCTLSHPKRRCGMGNPMYLRKTGSGIEFPLILFCFSRLVLFLFFFGTCWANTVLFMSCSVQDEGWFFWAFCKKKGLFLALLCFLLYFFDFFWHVQLPNKDAPYSKYWHLVLISFFKILWSCRSSIFSQFSLEFFYSKQEHFVSVRSPKPSVLLSPRSLCDKRMMFINHTTPGVYASTAGCSECMKTGFWFCC